MPPKMELPTSENIEEKIKNAVDNNATNNPHATVDPTTGKMAVVGDATELEVPTYQYEIEYEYTPEMLTAEEQRQCKEIDGRYYLTLTYSDKRVRPIYRTKVVMILTRVLADALIIDAEGYSSDYVEGNMIMKILDEHLDDILELARMVLGVEKSQLEYMTMPSLGNFFAGLINNEPNIIEECVNFLSRSLKNSEKKRAEKK